MQVDVAQHAQRLATAEPQRHGDDPVREAGDRQLTYGDNPRLVSTRSCFLADVKLPDGEPGEILGPEIADRLGIHQYHPSP